MSTYMDRDLWAQSREDDSQAFGEIFERNSRSIYNYLFRRCGDWAEAEDLMSIVFLEAWRKRREVELSHDSALPFLFGVATNVLRNRRRTEFRYRAALERMPPVSETDHRAGDIADRLGEEQEMREILRVFSRLPKRDQDVLSLCAWMGLSYEEAAVALDVPVGTVRSRLSRSKRRFRELLGERGHEVAGSAHRRAGQEVIS
jgi:RNA polymerase sigma factor (sigma-70 family)